MPIKNYRSEQMVEGYHTDTGRFKYIEGTDKGPVTRVVFIGDSTIDNAYWVQSSIAQFSNPDAFAAKTETVLHQTAKALYAMHPERSYALANLAIDGAESFDILRPNMSLDIVDLQDADHNSNRGAVNQLSASHALNPDVVVLSVGGNDYRGALHTTLRDHISSKTDLLFRNTPEEAKEPIKHAFEKVKQDLINNYTAIVDDIMTEQRKNPNFRMVLCTQYYPELTPFTLYHIYDGFAHVAHVDDINKSPMVKMQETLNEVYSAIMEYCREMHYPIIMADMTNTLNPAGGNNTSQIEPNAKGAAVMGQLIAHAINFPQNQMATTTPVLAFDSGVLKNSDRFFADRFDIFINKAKYQHVQSFFARKSTLSRRYVSAYHMLAGKSFDPEYSGLPAFGLLDIAVVTAIADHLMQKVLYSQSMSLSAKIAVGVVAAPLVLVKYALTLALMIALALPIYLFHKVLGIADTRELIEDETALRVF